MCPDTMISGGSGSQDVIDVTGSVVNEMRCVEYTRLLNTGTSMCTRVSLIQLCVHTR